MAEEDKEKSTLGEEWGNFAGYKPEEALRVYQGYQAELAAENQRLRDEAARATTVTVEPKKVAPEPPSVDLDVIRGEDKDKAAEELNRHTREVVGDVVKEQFASRDQQDLPIKRQQAKVAAAEVIRQAGGDFSELSETLDKYMAHPDSKMSPQQQADPNMWVQAFTALKGIQAMRGQETTNSGAPHVERPTPSSPQNRTKAVLTPIESEVRDNFARVAGEPISDDEWAFFRDKGQGNDEPRMNIDDYEEYVLKQASKQKARR